jgi:hypothetical protein
MGREPGREGQPDDEEDGAAGTGVDLEQGADALGEAIHIDAGLDGQWSSSADLETIKACRQQNGLLLGVSTAFEPVAAAGSNDVLRYGAAGHIFLGWVPLT